MVFSDTVKPIGLGSSNIGAGYPTTASGWGQLGAEKEGPKYLHFVGKPTISNDECRQHWGDSITDSHICTFKGVGTGT